MGFQANHVTFLDYQDGKGLFRDEADVERAGFVFGFIHLLCCSRSLISSSCVGLSLLESESEGDLGKSCLHCKIVVFVCVVDRLLNCD